MKTLSREAQAKLDRMAVECAYPLLLLMEGAARSALELLREVAPDLDKVALFCGTGNNAGDAYALARLLLAEGHSPIVFSLVEKANLSPCALTMREAYVGQGGLVEAMEAMSETELEAYFSETANRTWRGYILVDGLLGTGYRQERPLAGLLRVATCAMNRLRLEQGVQVLALDLPSGVDANSGAADEGAVEADWTISFVWPKTGIVTYPGRMKAGCIKVGSIGLSERFCEAVLAEEALVEWVDEAFVRRVAPQRKADWHKGQFGKGLMICGSPGQLGAAILAGQAALASGLGYLYAFVPESLYEAAVSALPSVLWQALPMALYEEEAANRLSPAQLEAEWRSILEPYRAQVSTLLCGSGLGRMARSSLGALTRVLLSMDEKRLILDADALNVLSMESDWKQLLLSRLERQESSRCCGGEVLITPHPREFQRLFGDLPGSRLEQAEAVGREGIVQCILKGAGTVLAFSSQKLLVNSSGNAGMGKAGSGDALAGILLALLAQLASEEGRQGCQTHRGSQVGQGSQVSQISQGSQVGQGHPSFQGLQSSQDYQDHQGSQVAPSVQAKGLDFDLEVGAPQRVTSAYVDAVSAAVYIHGLAADWARKDFGERSISPETYLGYLPRVYQALNW